MCLLCGICSMFAHWGRGIEGAARGRYVSSRLPISVKVTLCLPSEALAQVGLCALPVRRSLGAGGRYADFGKVLASGRDPGAVERGRGVKWAPWSQ